MAELSLSNIGKTFGSVRVIEGLNLDIDPGEFVVFVGPSGCGKSTMLRMIAGLEDVTTGSIHLGGADVTLLPPAKRGVAMVFQSYALFPHMTVAENIGFGLRLQRVDRAEIAERVRAVAETLQLTPLLDRVPRELSGGQRQRVAIGRAIMRDPKVFLFDEPLSNLDAALRVQMRLEIARLHTRLHATMIYVTHDQVEAMTLADRIVVFNGGRIEQVGTPMDLYAKPANRFVASFIGAPAMNFLPAELQGTELFIRGATGPFSISSKSISVAEVGVRPEHLFLCDPDEADFIGEVEIVERLGAETYAYVRIPDLDENVTLRLGGNKVVSPNTRAALRVDRENVHLFEADGRAVG
jgi:ABC-type sugar transport system ATPase subunit